MSKKTATIFLAATTIIAAVSTIMAIFYNKKYKRAYCKLKVHQPYSYSPEKDPTLKAIKTVEIEDNIDE